MKKAKKKPRKPTVPTVAHQIMMLNNRITELLHELHKLEAAHRELSNRLAAVEARPGYAPSPYQPYPPYPRPQPWWPDVTCRPHQDDLRYGYTGHQQ